MTNDMSRRSVLKMGAASVALLPVGAGLLAGCGGDGSSSNGGEDLLAIGRKQGYLRIAIGNEPPYSLAKSDGTLTGAEPDVFREICKRLDIPDIQGIITPYPSMIPGLIANRWDATSALFMKGSRCQQVAYAEPVIVSTESFAVLKGNPKDILTLADVVSKGIKVATYPGSFEAGTLQGAGMPDGQLVGIEPARAAIDALKGGRADAVFLPTLTLETAQKSDPSFEVTAPVPDAPKTGSGAAFRKEDKSFFQAYNKELKAFKASSDFDALMDKWGFDADAARNATTAELCKNPG